MTLGRKDMTQWDWRSEKVQAEHRDRLAEVYVRQSTPQQVVDHQESTRLQYGLRTQAQELGWAPDRVLVIDDDLGRSGTSVQGRLGFQRLVSEVSLDHVGIILGIEISRLARSCADFCQLLELCALFGTLIADGDGIYDPGQYNDRLLLGLKGTMSEAKLHIMQQRMRQGVLAKARRGKLIAGVPTGYVRRPSGEVILDPDEQVQHVIRLIFRKFDELGTPGTLWVSVLRYLVQQQIQLGIRVRSGPDVGELEWRRPSRITLQNLLKHPIYAGAYAYGRRQVDPHRKVPGRPASGRVIVERAAWVALITDQMPAYISWEQYERNLAQLEANRARGDRKGAVREGAALLTGLVICGRCGCRVAVCYRGREKGYLYTCNRRRIDYGEASCQELAGPGLDHWVSNQVLLALEPAALDLSLEAAQYLERERDDLDRLWRQRLERAAYETDRARRQYHLVEPENRLVARQVERDWEQKLATQQHLEEDYHRVLVAQPRVLTTDERAAIRDLAADIPALWSARTTVVTERKEIVRQVVERVVVTVQGDSERVAARIEWAGGMQTAGEIVGPVARLEQLSYYPQLCDRVRQLAAAGQSAAAIAGRLNAEGYRPPKRRDQFGPAGVSGLVRRLAVRITGARARPPVAVRPHEWELRDLAQELDMPPVTLYNWLARHWVTGRREEEPPHRWILWADDAERDRLRQHRQRSLSDEARHRWTTASSLIATPTTR